MKTLALALVLALASLSAAQAGWDGTSDMFGTHWRNNRTGQSITCTRDMFGTHCN